MDNEVKEPEGEQLTAVQGCILWFNTNYSIRQEDGLKHFRRQGEKDKVRVELRLFNGKPQVVVFYGKTRYTFKVLERTPPQPHKALMRITGYTGIAKVNQGKLDRYFSDAEQKLRAAMLSKEGV
jgi:hypothetical protein